jgi:hypothetical protein
MTQGNAIAHLSIHKKARVNVCLKIVTRMKRKLLQPLGVGKHVDFDDLFRPGPSGKRLLSI